MDSSTSKGFGPSSDPAMLRGHWVVAAGSLLLLALGGVILLLVFSSIPLGILAAVGVSVVLVGAGVAGLRLLNGLWSLWWAYTPTVEAPEEAPAPHNPHFIYVNQRAPQLGTPHPQVELLPAGVDPEEERRRLQVERFVSFLRAAYQDRDLFK